MYVCFCRVYGRYMVDVFNEVYGLCMYVSVGYMEGICWVI